MSASKAPLESWGETAARSTAAPPLSLHRSTSGMRPCFAGSPSRGERGFTLLELSIVLVIIGLIVGGITVGADMIRAAELRSVITEKQRYETAVNVFKDKYFYLPGDMPNATAFWGEAGTGSYSGGCPGTLDPSTDTGTCDGDGDGKIDNDSNHEAFRAWQHLANARLIEGQYAGVSGPVDDYYGTTAGFNIPASKAGGEAAWFLAYDYCGSDSWCFTAFDYGNALMFGGATGTQTLSNRAISAPDAWSIDRKVDDGKAGYGKVMSTYNNTCTTDYTVRDAEYDVDEDGIDCGFFFLTSF